MSDLFRDNTPLFSRLNQLRPDRFLPGASPAGRFTRSEPPFGRNPGPGFPDTRTPGLTRNHPAVLTASVRHHD